MRSAKVPLSPSSALQTMYFWSRCVVEHGLPLDAGREAGAAAAAQAGLGDFLDDLGRRHRQGLAQALQPVMRFVVVERHRIDDAAAREGEPRLLREERDFLGIAERQLVLPPERKPASKQASDIAGLDRAVSKAAAADVSTSTIGSREVCAARAVAHDRRRRCRARQISCSTARATLSAPSASAPESPGTIDRHAHERTSATISSILAASSRPMTSPSSMADGEQAQSPRQ